MTRKERLTRCYFNQELDRPAVYTRAGYPKDDPSYAGLRAFMEENTALKVGWSGRRFLAGPATEVTVEPFSDDFQRRVETLHTPRGDLVRTHLVSLRGQPGLHERHFVNSPEDAEAYLSLPIPEVSGDVSSFRPTCDGVGDSGIAEVGLGFNPAGFVAELCGSENFAVMSLTDRDLIHRLCEQQLCMLTSLVEFLVERGVGPFFAMLGEEYLVPPLHGRADFHDFNVRYDKPIIDLIHEAGGRIHVHSHGSIKRVIEGFVDMGVDVLHPFEPPPQGDILAHEAKDIVRGKLCLEGNIQIHRMYEATAAEIRAETEALIAAAFDDGRGLIVCPTASPYIRGEGEHCFPQYKAMVDAVLGWRG
ncbi:MAG: hypothetical protein HN742_11720 [Lentisphaerae bacterium]|jgi:hypothetical protein|nr:hypothetical protein [Lentisphaerota bacterium]MBT4820809.1 hypothetical protein [Lentisphaerota bacterium]MBT5609621.1 hypothetical protein [Lentisphaerota bacterium]MBT7060869.1 hypothetical protein [Lentisphaerota bacterium]MBT7842536.1 hypothetical protein [Lentisphaerota bacterium]